MRKLAIATIIISCIAVLTSCNDTNPETQFGIAVLNSNMMQGFASDGLQREMESPSVQMIDGDKDKFAPMKRNEIIQNKIASLESNFSKLKKLKETSDNRQLLKASRDLYNYVLPVYKNEYLQLAKLYDEGSSNETIGSYTTAIHDKYYNDFIALHEKLVAEGKPFAQKHGINVQWDIRTSPR
jgi:hypothetical protein